MQTLEIKNKTYALDDNGFLADPSQWDEDFAAGMATRVGIQGDLTLTHWNVLKFIRAVYLETGSSPIVFKTCKTNKLSLKELRRLFPAGYQRGACKLAGLSFMAGGGMYSTVYSTRIPKTHPPIAERVYRVNVQGFLVDTNEWDEEYASFRARELQISGPLSEKHWEIIKYLRSEFEIKGEIPTVYATCAAVGIDIDELAELFPSGYHRGAVKIAGLNIAA